MARVRGSPPVDNTGPMEFRSTRAAAGEAPARLSDALAAGLAPDGGLYLPAELPRLGKTQLERAGERALDPDLSRALTGVAEITLDPFFRGDPLQDDLGELCREAFEVPAPLVDLRDADHAERGAGPRASQALLELFHGPTAAFKDYAARFLAGALSRIPTDRDRHVLVATSGDTGSAVAAAFHDRPGYLVTLLYPVEGVSPRQAHLLSCFGGNVRAFRVRGSFDDAQRIVKEALGDRHLVESFGLTSANSISLGRLLPQMTWFAFHSLRWQATRGERPGFIIPSGNFGHGLACLWARWMGFPVGDVLLATNRNRALVDWVGTGRATPRPALRTPANAMDVGIPSNLERLRAQHPSPGPLRRDRGGFLEARSVLDDEILNAVGRAPDRWGAVVCPHTACALHLLGELRGSGDARPWIALATAHPAKFPEIVEPLVGHPVAVPDPIARLLERPAEAGDLEPGPDALTRLFPIGR
jgi:threonine synthase